MFNEEVILKSNLIGSIHRPIAPYELWIKSKVNLTNTEMLPFDSFVMAHINFRKLDLIELTICGPQVIVGVNLVSCGKHSSSI
eukprot:gene5997-12084_t